MAVWAYKRNGHWLYRNEETERRFGRKFIAATDAELALGLKNRALLFSIQRMNVSTDLTCLALLW
jgi:hypothetical protein